MLRRTHKCCTTHFEALKAVHNADLVAVAMTASRLALDWLKHKWTDPDGRCRRCRRHTNRCNGGNWIARVTLDIQSHNFMSTVVDGEKLENMYLVAVGFLLLCGGIVISLWLDAPRRTGWHSSGLLYVEKWSYFLHDVMLFLIEIVLCMWRRYVRLIGIRASGSVMVEYRERKSFLINHLTELPLENRNRRKTAWK